MKKVILGIQVVFLVLVLSGVGWGQKSFVVVGTSQQQGEGEQKPSLEMAIKDGLMKAIEAAVASMVAPREIKERHETLSQEFYQRTDAFILSYIIVEETPIESGYQVSLEVVVDTKGIESRLISLGLFKGREEGPGLREVQVVVSGIRSYDTYRAVEQLLGADAEVESFSPAEITPPLFTWRVMLKDRFLSYDFGRLKAKVGASSQERLEVVLSR
jgi:hypothetical protein